MRVLYNTPLTEKFLNDLDAKVMKAAKEKQINSAFGGKLTNGVEKVRKGERERETETEPQFDQVVVISSLLRLCSPCAPHTGNFDAAQVGEH